MLVLSAAGNELPFVAREVERAVSKRKAVFPIRVEQVLPAPGLELFVSSTHWIDAWSGKLAPKIDELAALIAEEEAGKRALPRTFPAKQSRWTERLASRPVRAGLAALGVLLLAIAGWSAYRGEQAAEGSAVAAASIDAAPSAPPESKAPAPDPAAQLWPEVKDSQRVSMLEAFVARFPELYYADLAKAKLADLKADAERKAEAERQAELARQAEAERQAEAARQAEQERKAEEARKAEEEAAARAKETQVAVLVPPAPVAPPAPQYKPGDTFRDCDNCPEMVVVPAGSFTMGAPEDNSQREVTIASPFAIGKFEVTRDQFDAFVKDSGYDAGSSCETFEEDLVRQRSSRSFRNPGFSQSGNEHVACVNWDDAQAYATWLSQKTGQAYRLPTDSEWEYAERGGSQLRLASADEGEACRVGNFHDLTAAEALNSTYYELTCYDGHVYTAPVGSLRANAFGLYDMLGNVGEWVEDCGHQNYTGAPRDGTAWTSGGDCSTRVIRGG